MESKLFSTARFLVAIVLVAATLSYSEVYFILVKVLVSCVAAWGIFGLSQADKGSRLGIWTLFYILALYIYFPFSNFQYESADWILLDLIFAVGFVATLFAHEGELARHILGTDKNVKWNKRFFQFLCVATLFLGLSLGYLALKPMLTLKALQSKGATATARVTKVSERWSGGGEDVSFDGYRINYEFKTPDGRSFKGKSDEGVNPLTQLSENEIMEKYGGEYVMGPNEHYPVLVYFNRENPKINAASYDAEQSIRLLLLKAFFFEGLAVAIILIVAVRSFGITLRKDNEKTHSDASEL